MIRCASNHFKLQPLPAPKVLTQQELLDLFAGRDRDWWAPRELELLTEASRITLNRRLAEAVATGLLEARGKGALRQYRYVARAGVTAKANILLAPLTVEGRGTTGPQWSKHSVALRQHVQQPRGARTPVTYQETLVGDYVPNHTFWLPEPLRTKLAAVGRSSGERPAGTYARDVLGQLLIDLAWSSSRLEGNRYSRLETKNLIEAGASANGKTRQESVMILNHKKAIEFLVDVAAHDDPLHRVVRNIHSLLMDGLLRDERGLGAIRQRVVVIEDSVYTPWQTPVELERMYRVMCEKAQAIVDPLEGAFFLFTQLPYLQPFEDGNKRTSRIACNLPLAKANWAPLAFLDVEDADYFSAFLALYEMADVAVAIDLFEWAYLRSVQSYAAVRQAMRDPDPFRARLREALNVALQGVVARGLPLPHAVAELALASEVVAPFTNLVTQELAALNEFNHARYGLTYRQFAEWEGQRRSGAGSAD